MHNDELVRLDMIRNLEIADVVFILEDYDSQRKYIDIFKPSIIVHGNDWKGDSLYKQMNITIEQIEDYNIEFSYPSYTKGVSSTIIREAKIEEDRRMRKLYADDPEHCERCYG